MVTTPGLKQANLLMEARALLNQQKWAEAREVLLQLEPWCRGSELALIRRVKNAPDESLESLLGDIENKLLPRYR